MRAPPPTTAWPPIVVRPVQLTPPTYQHSEATYLPEIPFEAHQHFKNLKHETFRWPPMSSD